MDLNPTLIPLNRGNRWGWEGLILKKIKLSNFPLWCWFIFTILKLAKDVIIDNLYNHSPPLLSPQALDKFLNIQIKRECE